MTKKRIKVREHPREYSPGQFTTVKRHDRTMTTPTLPHETIKEIKEGKSPPLINPHALISKDVVETITDILLDLGYSAGESNAWGESLMDESSKIDDWITLRDLFCDTILDIALGESDSWRETIIEEAEVLSTPIKILEWMHDVIITVSTESKIWNEGVSNELESFITNLK